MPWQPLPRIAFAIATFPFAASSPADLPLEIGDELYIIEETPDGNWLRGYLVAPPSLLAGLTSVKGQTLEARVFSGVFPRSCVEVREVLGEGDETEENDSDDDAAQNPLSPPPLRPGGGVPGSEAQLQRAGSDSAKSGLAQGEKKKRKLHIKTKAAVAQKSSPVGDTFEAKRGNSAGAVHLTERLSIPVTRDPNAPRPPAPVPMLKIGDETPTSASEPLIDEIASCLREWHSTNLHELLLSRQYAKLDQLSHLITTLNTSRQQFLHGVLTSWEHAQLREKTVWDLVRVNKLCGGEVIVRDPGERGRVLTGDDSVVEVTKLQSVMSMLEEPPTGPVAEASALHHLMVDVKGFAGTSSEATTLVIYLARKDLGVAITPLSESYIVEVPAGGHLSRRVPPMRTLFADLTASDIGDAASGESSELFLVVKIRAMEQVAPAKPSSRSGSVSQNLVSGFGSRDHSKPPLSAGNKSMRRSLMWAAGKGTRSAFSRGAANPKLDALSEGSEGRPLPSPNATGPDSRDGAPPSAPGSRVTRPSLDSAAEASATSMADRTVGVGLLRLNPIMKQQQGEEHEYEHVISMWAPSSRFSNQGGAPQGEQGWDSAIHEVLDGKSGSFEKSRRGERVQVHLRAFNSPDADVLIKTTPTLLADICKTNKMGFAGAPTKPRSDIYVTVDEAALTRQTLLSRWGGSPTSIPNGMHGNNLQVSLEVRRSSGERIESCIFPSSNTEAVSVWKTTASERGEPWRQTVRLALSPQDVYAAHLVLHLSDLPHPPFALAYMPLWDQQAFMRDGPHGLLLYKVDDNVAAPNPGPQGKGGYFNLPFAAKGRDDVAEVTGPLAILRVDSYLCSTRFSQDRVLLTLLKWKETSKQLVPDLLKQFTFVAEIEVVKLLNDVLDALFGILVDFSGNDEYEDLGFAALVRVLDIVHDRRFNLAPLVDHYAETRFDYPFATPCLVRSFTRLLSNPTGPETSRKLRATFKVVRLILKFINHGRGQQKIKEAGIGINSITTTPTFTRNLRGIFKALDAMMSNAAPVLVGSQTLAVQHFHTWLPELSGLLSTEEILHVAIDFVDSCSAVRGKLVLYKLVLIINYSRLDIFRNPEQRAALSANTVRWIAPHWGSPDEPATDQWREQVRLCCSVLATQIEHLGPEIPDYIPKIVQSYLAIQGARAAKKQARAKRRRMSLLFPTSYPFPTRSTTEDVDFDEALVELSAVLSALSNAPGGMQLELADDDLGTLVESSLRVHMSILQGEAFPTNWLSVFIYHHKSTMRTLQYLASILLESFLPHPDDAESFNTELWKLFFTTLLKLVGSPSLALETFPEQKRRAVWKIAGDVREHGAELLRRTWEAIGWETSPEERKRYGLSKMGGYQVQYVPTLVSPIVELCLSVHEGLRRMAVEVLQTMIVSEWTLSEDLSVIQTETIDCLDAYFESKPLTESILQKLFVNELLDRFEPLRDLPQTTSAREDHEELSLYTSLRELMATVDELLDLLVAVYSGDGTASSGTAEATNLINRLRLMEFLRDINKEEIFIRYVHQLARLQADEAHNHAEAGLALRLHADIYDWDPTRTTPALHDPKFPAQSQFERKERIYFEMILHFEEGEAWASALEAYGELRRQYETNTFEFAKLARTERAIATIHETISRSDRLVPKYFKVVFRGLGFPASVRDKSFVFEGATPTERTATFTDRLQEQYPAAQIQIVLAGSDRDRHNPAAGPGTSGGGGGGGGGGGEDGDGNRTNTSSLEGQFLVVSAVSPHRNLAHPVFGRARVPQALRDLLVTASHPHEFSVSSKRSTTGPVGEHYAEKIVYSTAEPFPTILRRSEIVSVNEIRLSATETALERIVRKTAEMTAVERKVAEGGEGVDDAARLLADAVSVSVNPNSDSSVVCYRQLIPGKHHKKRNEGGERQGEESGGADGGAAEFDEEEDEDEEEPEPDAQENAIRMALVDHAIMIKRCLATFAKSGNESLSKRVDDLQLFFETTFAPEIAFYTPPAQPPRTDFASAPSPPWGQSPNGLRSTSPQQNPSQPLYGHQNSSSSSNVVGGSGDVSNVLPVVGALRASRGARLSFLGRQGSKHKKNGSFGGASWSRAKAYSRGGSRDDEGDDTNTNNNNKALARTNTTTDRSRSGTRDSARQRPVIMNGSSRHSLINGNSNRLSFFRSTLQPAPPRASPSRSSLLDTSQHKQLYAPSKVDSPISPTTPVGFGGGGTIFGFGGDAVTAVTTAGVDRPSTTTSIAAASTGTPTPTNAPSSNANNKDWVTTTTTTTADTGNFHHHNPAASNNNNNNDNTPSPPMPSQEAGYYHQSVLAEEKDLNSGRVWNDNGNGLAISPYQRMAPGTTQDAAAGAQQQQEDRSAPPPNGLSGINKMVRKRLSMRWLSGKKGGGRIGGAGGIMGAVDEE